MPGCPPPLSPLSPLPCFCVGHMTPLNHTLGTRLDGWEDSAGTRHKVGSAFGSGEGNREHSKTQKGGMENVYGTSPSAGERLVLLCLYVQRMRRRPPRHHHPGSCSAGHTPPPHGNLACSRQLLHILTFLRTNGQDGYSLQPPFPPQGPLHQAGHPG